MMELTDDYRRNVAAFDLELQVEKNFDLIKKELFLGDKEATLYYIDGFVSSTLNKLLTYFASIEKEHITGTYEERANRFALRHLPFVESEVSDDGTAMLRAVLSGEALLLAEDFGANGIIIDARSYPARKVGEPENDRVIIGSRDGFVETLVFNTALIRRRIRDPNLRMEYLNIGSRSQTDIVLCYLSDLADKDYVLSLKEKLEHLKTESVTLGHESIAELLIRKKWYNPFPKIRYTERPDVAAAQILEGSVALICDNSPEVMILPCSIFDFMQETNDFYLPPLTGTYIRFVRYLIFLATLFVIPLWFLMTKEPESAPAWLSFALPLESGRIPIFIQLILVELMIDGLRMACMNTPDMLSNSLSVVGGLILGDFAVDVGWLIPEVIVYTAFVSIANFSPRSYELSYAFKFMRITLVILIELFGKLGFFLGVILLVFLLADNQTPLSDRSYLYPLIPFRPKALCGFFIRRRKRD